VYKRLKHVLQFVETVSNAALNNSDQGTSFLGTHLDAYFIKKRMK
jgi:hypothetical protein